MILHALVVPLSPVREYELREGVAEEVDESLRSVVGRIAVCEVAVLGKRIHAALRSESEIRVLRCITVTQQLEALGAFQYAVGVRNRELAGSVPVGALLLYIAELVEEGRLRAESVGPVLKGEQHLVPVGIHHCGYGEGSLVILSQPGPLAGELVAFEYLRAGVVVTADLGAHSAAVETALPVDELAVVVENEMVALLLIAGYRLLQRSIAALALVRRIVRVAVVHSLGPPAEKEDGIAARSLSRLIHLSVEVGIFEEILSVLMLEYDPLPAWHILLHPFRSRGIFPPAVHPLAVDVRRLVPAATVRRHHIGLAGPALPAEAVRILEKAEFQAIELAGLALVGPQTVPGVLESSVVAAEIQALLPSEEAEAVHKDLGPVFHVLLTEELFRFLVWGRVQLAEQLLRIVIETAAGLGSVELVVLREHRPVKQRIMQLAYDAVRFIVGHAAAEAQLVILENHGQIEGESDFFAPDHERVVAYEYAVALNADVRGLILGADLNLLLGRAIIVESPEQATRGIVVTGLEIA